MVPAGPRELGAQSEAPARGHGQSTKPNLRTRRNQIPSLSTTASRESPSRRCAAASRRCFIVSDFSRYAVSRSDAISRHNSIGMITAVGSPSTLETIWISVSGTASVYLLLTAFKSISPLTPPLPTQARPAARIFGFSMVRMSNWLVGVLTWHHAIKAPRQNEPSNFMKIQGTGQYPTPFSPGLRRAIIPQDLSACRTRR